MFKVKVFNKERLSPVSRKKKTDQSLISTSLKTISVPVTKIKDVVRISYLVDLNLQVLLLPHPPQVLSRLLPSPRDFVVDHFDHLAERYSHQSWSREEHNTTKCLTDSNLTSDRMRPDAHEAPRPRKLPNLKTKILKGPL